MSIYPVNKFKSNIFPGIAISSLSPTPVYNDAEVVGEGYALITSVIASNKTNTPRKISLIIEKTSGVGTNSAYLLYDVVLPANTAFEVIEGNKFVLKENDRLLAYSDAEAGATGGAVDMTVCHVVHIPPTTP